MTLNDAAKSLQLCPTLCDPIDGSPPGSPVSRILQARTLEWVAISFSNVWKWKVKVKSLSRVGLLATPWTTAYQAPPSMGFSMQEYWSEVPLPSLMTPSRNPINIRLIIAWVSEMPQLQLLCWTKSLVLRKTCDLDSFPLDGSLVGVERSDSMGIVSPQQEVISDLCTCLSPGVSPLEEL